ncbi:RnfABCDGE type electron transport complex subunit D [Acholeplasma hippikon]|nr:RnfABCDGE type electron transport complex subunit D [Acholeplasma hippikon]
MQKVNIVPRTSPYVRKETSTKRMMVDVLIALTPVTFFSVYKYGMDALTRILVSLLVFILVEAVYFLSVTKAEGDHFSERLSNKFKKYSINNLTAPAVSGLIYAMLLPDQLPFYAVIMGALFGSLVGKMIFGGLGFNIFNPAALGRVFIAISFTTLFQGSYGAVDAAAGATPLSTQFPNVFNSYSLIDMLTGNIPGAMGEINSILILMGMAYLIIRKSADFRPILSASLIFVVLTTIAGYFLQPNHLVEFVLYHLLSGGLLFGLAFMVTDPATSPVSRPGRWYFGLIIGTVIFAIRIFGNLPEGVAFALLFANMLTPVIDYPLWSTNKFKTRFFVTYGVSFALITLFGFLLLGGYIA